MLGKISILVRLPARCVLRLRSVCRSWRRLTSEPSFVRAHTVHTRRQHAADGSGRRVLEPTVHQLCNNVRATETLSLEASCDGLLCFRSYRWPYYVCNPVCNPVTRIWTTVPTSTRVRNSGAYSQRLCGFYFHRPTQKYRLLHCAFNCVNDQLEVACEVATVGAGEGGASWRTIYELRVPKLTEDDGTARDDLHLHGAEALALFGLREPGCGQVNGSLHWLHSLSHEFGVVAFDMESENFRRMSAPSDFGARDWQIHPLMFRICKIRGNLCVGRITEKGPYAGELELWMLEDYARQQWVPMHTLQPDRHGFMRTIRPRGVGRVSCHDEDEEEERGDGGELLVRWGEDNFSLYDFELKTYEPTKIPNYSPIILDHYGRVYYYEHPQLHFLFERCDLIYYTEGELGRSV